MRFNTKRSPGRVVMRRGFAGGATVLAVIVSACGSPPSESAETATADQSPTVASARLVHDIPSGHPRLPYFDEFSETVSASTDGRLAVEINPDGEVLAGRASLDAVQSGAAELALVNMTHVEGMESQTGFMNLPFAFDDATMADGRNRTAVFDVQAELVRPHGVEFLGYMRGADQLFAFPQEDVNQVEDLADRRIRVAGTGIYEQTMQRLGAEPVAIPIPEIKERMARGEVDGVFTSPGGWTTQVFDTAPHAIQIPGLMYISYALVANKDWFDQLPADQREAVAAAGVDMTEQWVQMAEDDQTVVDKAVADGGTYRVLPDQEVARWRDRVIGISDEFYVQHPAVAEKLRQRGLLATQ